MFKEEGYFSWRAASLIWSLESFTGIFVQHKMFSIYGPEKLWLSIRIRIQQNLDPYGTLETASGNDPFLLCGIN